MAGADSCHRRRYAVNYPQYVQDCSRWIQSLFFHKIINICLPLADIIRNQNVSDFGLDVLALHGSSSHVSSRFPDSPIFTLSYLLTKMGMQWFFKTVLLAYSGRTVRDFHPIPYHAFSNTLSDGFAYEKAYHISVDSSIFTRCFLQHLHEFISL